MIFDKKLMDDIFHGEKGVCFFVHEEKYYWVVDYKYHFSLNAEKDYREYLIKGYITEEQYFKACREFRGGVLNLTCDNFLKYIFNHDLVLNVFTRLNMEDVLFENNNFNVKELLKRVEYYYSFSQNLSDDDFCNAQVLASRLPLFYVNFDKKIYMHMDFGRTHETLSYPDWVSGCSDFCYLIPDEERYWVKNGDYWKVRFL